jgi:hypothetical protein
MHHRVGDKLRHDQEYPVTALGRAAEIVQPLSDRLPRPARRPRIAVKLQPQPVSIQHTPPTRSLRRLDMLAIPEKGAHHPDHLRIGVAPGQPASRRTGNQQGCRRTRAGSSHVSTARSPSREQSHPEANALRYQTRAESTNPHRAPAAAPDLASPNDRAKRPPLLVLKRTFRGRPGCPPSAGPPAARRTVPVYIDALVPVDGQSGIDLLPEGFAPLSCEPEPTSMVTDGSRSPTRCCHPRGSSKKRSGRATSLGFGISQLVATFTEPIHLANASSDVRRAFIRCTGGELDVGGDPIEPMAAQAAPEAGCTAS